MSGSKKTTKSTRAKPRPDLAAVLAAKAATLDKNRPEARAKRKKTGHWTARQNIDALLDKNSFQEYGQLALPAFKIRDGAADGLVMGTGTVDGARVAVAAYDYTVHAGTQATINHAKTDRLFHMVERLRLPLVFWVEGGGWRPHENNINARDYEETFAMMAKLSGLVPTVGIVAGRCFAGNANVAGLCDTLIATRKAAMGMAGPPLVESALGIKLTPEELGPPELHEKSGAIDVLVENEKEAVAVVRLYLSYFRGAGPAGKGPDTAPLRDVIPESARRAYDVRKVIEGIADVGSVLELRPRFGRAAITSLIKIAGTPVGVLANQPMFLAGAMDSPACDKLARFIQLCDAHDIPMLYLCDTPGLMVGPDVEATALVRHSSRILTAAVNATAPFMTIVLRKAYGLGYYMMGSLPVHPALLVAWPTAEFGAMGLEGAVKITHKLELEAIADQKERLERERELADEIRARNTALETASRYEFDDVIDPADTRDVILKFLTSLPPVPPRTTRKRTIDNW
jgi:acetyl-CoA carboxylase carboxyltransferase component